MNQLTVGSLFSGIGGIDLGLERAGMVTRWFSEIDPYASRVLAKHWPTIPNHGDITKINFATVEPVDVLCGGFPCQDLSNAGKRAGMDGKRSGLWSEYVRAIRDVRPRYVLVENVSALLSGGNGDWLARVLGDLALLGFDAEWTSVTACAVGAPHMRARVFLVAYPDSERRSDGGKLVHQPSQSRSQSRIRQHGEWGIWDRARVQRVADGVPARVDRLRGLGNAVVPQIPELIGGWIIEHAQRASA